MRISQRVKHIKIPSHRVDSLALRNVPFDTCALKRTTCKWFCEKLKQAVISP